MNSIKEQEVIKELEKNNRQKQEKDRIVYVKERTYVLNNKRI